MSVLENYLIDNKCADAADKVTTECRKSNIMEIKSVVMKTRRYLEVTLLHSTNMAGFTKRFPKRDKNAPRFTTPTPETTKFFMFRCNESNKCLWSITNNLTAQTKLFMAKGVNWRETTALMVTPHVEPDLYGIPRVSVITPLIPKPRDKDTFNYFLFSATETRLAQSGFIAFGGVINAENFEIWNPRLYMACELANCTEDHDMTTGHCAGSSKSTGTIRGMYGEIRCQELFPNRQQPEKFANRDVAKFFVNGLVLKNRSLAYDEFALGDKVDEVLATYQADGRPFVIMGWVKAPFEEDGHQVIRELHVSRFHPIDYHVYDSGKYGDPDPDDDAGDIVADIQTGRAATAATVKAAAATARETAKTVQADKARAQSAAAASRAKRRATSTRMAKSKKTKSVGLKSAPLKKSTVSKKNLETGNSREIPEPLPSSAGPSVRGPSPMHSSDPDTDQVNSPKHDSTMENMVKDIFGDE